jgi:hypothetical protein
MATQRSLSVTGAPDPPVVQLILVSRLAVRPLLWAQGPIDGWRHGRNARRGMTHALISISDPTRLYVMTFVLGLLGCAGWYLRRPK